MHVDIEMFRRHFDEERCYWVTSHRQKRVVCLHHGVGQGAVLNGATVDKKIDVRAVGAGDGGQADVAGDDDRRRRNVGKGMNVHKVDFGGQIVGRAAELGRFAFAHRNQLARFVRAVDLGQHFQRIATACGLEDHAPVHNQAEAPIRVDQRHPLDHGADVASFGGRLAQVLFAGGDIVKEVLHVDDGAHWQPGAALPRDLAPFCVKLGAEFFVFVAAAQGEMAHRGDGVERFAAKAKGEDVFQILHLAHFARGVTFQRQRNLVAGDAAAIVHHAQQTLPTVLDLYADLGGAGVNAIFDQFFGGIGRPFHHFACCDLGGHVRR